MFPRLLCTSAFFFLSTLGCQHQAPPGYPGEELAVISGFVYGALEQAPEPMEVVLIWLAGSVEQIREKSYPGTTAPVSGEFPGHFEMPLYHPPPSSAFHYKGHDLDFAIAMLFALPVGSIVDGRVPWMDMQPESLGFAPRNQVVYLAEDAQPDSPMANYLGYTAKAGYHILEAGLIYQPVHDAWYDCRMSEASEPNLDLCYEMHCPANSDNPDHRFLSCGNDAYEEACGPKPASELVDLGNRAEISITMNGLLAPPYPEGTVVSYPFMPFPRERTAYVPDVHVDALCND